MPVGLSTACVAPNAVTIATTGIACHGVHCNVVNLTIEGCVRRPRIH